MSVSRRGTELSEQPDEVESVVPETGSETAKLSELTRRNFLRKSAGTAAAVGLTGAITGTLTGEAAAGKRHRRPRRVPGHNRTIPLPSADRVRADYQNMVDFGPRLPGSREHHAYCQWVEDEFAKAGLELLPSDEIRYRSWRPGDIALKVGSNKYTPPTSFVRTPGTPTRGVTGPLVHKGDGPADGSILLVDLNIPSPTSAGIFIAMSAYFQWDGHTASEFASEDLNRFAISGWPGSLQSYADQGVKAIVFIVDAPKEEVEGNWSPHQSTIQPLPAVVVDRDMGAELKAKAASQPNATLTFDAGWDDSYVSYVTGILPGKSDEVVIVDSHTDGNNVFEENGSVALVHLARHFGSLRGQEKLDRTIVFLAWPGHYADVRNRPDDPNTLPEQYGWIPNHMDLFDRTVAAVTMEHLGAIHWDDTPQGYRSMNENEAYAIWTTLGPIQDLAKDALIRSKLQRHLILKPPIQVTPGVAWHFNGIPHIAGIAAPTYLLQEADEDDPAKGGGMDKLDAGLAAGQTAMYADMIRQLDTADPQALLTGGDGDSTFDSVSIRKEWPSKTDRARSGPARKVVFDAGDGRRLAVYVGGRKNGRRDLTVKLAALDGSLDDITVDVYRGQKLLGSSEPTKVGRRHKNVRVHRRGHRADHRNLRHNRRSPRFRNGSYTVVVSQGDEVLGRRRIRMGKSGRRH